MKHEELKDYINFYMQNYHIYPMHLKDKNVENKDKRFIGNKEKRKCRFCGKEKGETTFKKVAHAIPELVGNKVLISFEECDECNEIFAGLENELANYIFFERSTGGIRGKKGIPKYKNKKGLSVEFDKETENRLIVQDLIDSGNMIEDETDNSFTLKAERPPFVPIAVYKCLVKMALSVMPLKYLPYFWVTFDWILEKEHLKQQGLVLKIFEQFIPGVKPFNGVEMYLALKREESEENTPFCVFSICIGNKCYQVYLPFAGPDTIEEEGREMVYKLFPSKYALALPEGTIQPILKDFSSNVKIRGQEMRVTYTYGSKNIISKNENHL